MAASGAARQRPTIWEIPDDLWLIVQHVPPREELQRSRGRPWIPPRRILDAILYVLRTGCQWKAVPRSFASGSTEWTWQSADTSLHKAPLAGGKNRPQPDRPREVRDQAPHPHRRRRRADRHHDHRSEHA